jgi:hypothetical protein
MQTGYAAGSVMKYTWMFAFVVSSLSSAAHALDAGGPSSVTSLQRAFIEPSMVQSAIDLEKEISAQEALEAPDGESPLVVLKGNGNLIVTAPHATEPFREGRYRFSDGAGTAALAMMLHKLADATVIYTRYRTPSDPNYYDDNAFKKTLAELISLKKPALLLDIHGSHDFRPYEIDFGTMNGKSLLNCRASLTKLVASMRQEGIDNLSDNYFAAEKNLTIARFASARDVPTIQLEISSTWLRPSEGELMAHRFSQLLQGLARYARSVSSDPARACEAPPLGLAEPVLPR